MRPRLAAVLSALLVAALLPSTATAEAAVRFEEHHIGFLCEQSIDNGFVAAHVDVSDFGNFGGAEVWLGDAVPFEDPPTLSGGSENVTVTALAEGFELSATFSVVDGDGNDLGTGSIQATLTPSGDPEIFSSQRDGNRQIFVEGTFQPMDVSGTMTVPTIGELGLEDCNGDETFVRVLETFPHTFVNSNAGVVVSCNWGTEDSFAGLFAIVDEFGPFADAFLVTQDQELAGTGPISVELTSEALAAVIGLEDVATGDPAEATVEASLSPIGDPVTSVILSASAREKVTEQRLSASGELAFSTGQSFTLDDESCFANTFDSHFIDSGPAGPKAGGRAPANDPPDGALPLTVGSRTTAQTGGTAIEPELVPATCPDPESDAMGHTVWYTLEGTGADITVDTAGSNFDTVLAVYVLDGEDLVEIACVDDVLSDPIGVSFQAAISGPSVEGVTYYLQIGGFDSRAFFGGGVVEFGLLKVSVS